MLRNHMFVDAAVCCCYLVTFSSLYNRLDGPWMRAFSLYTLHSTFGFDSKVEQQLQPGITISKPVRYSRRAGDKAATAATAAAATDAAAGGGGVAYIRW